MAGPFDFTKPAELDQTGWDPGVKRQTLGIKRVSDVSLVGPGCDALTVAPNDASVVEVVEAVWTGSDQRWFRLTGIKAGDAMLEAKDTNGAVVTFMQVHVDQASPTLGPPVSGAPRTTGQGKNRITATLRTSPFPVTYADFSPDSKLQQALDAAMSGEPAAYQRITTAIVALNPDGTRPLAQSRGDETHFGASMIKIAAMYAAFELRATLRSIADELGGSVKQSDVLSLASAYLDPLIMAKVATIPPLVNASPGVCLPRYAVAFDVVPKSGVPGFTVNFSSKFQKALEEMIGPSSDGHAAQCIHGVGFGYLNGALASGGFFDPRGQNGFWLAGDYWGTYPVYRIPCVNDVDTAQGGSARQGARLMALLWDKLLVGSGSSAEMLRLLTLPPSGERYSEMGASANFSIMHVKIGYGQLKPTLGGAFVMSEGSIIKHTASNRMFAVGWLNLPHWAGDRSEPISARLAKTFDKYVNP